MDIFARATRVGLTFMYKGDISITDLWKLNPERLNALYITYEETLVPRGVQGLMKTTVDNPMTVLRLDIIRFIYETKKSEEEAAAKKVAKAQEKADLLELYQAKEKEKMGSLSGEEILKRIAEIDAS